MSGDTVTINTVTDTSEPVAVYTAGATGTGSNVALQMSSSDENAIGYALYAGTDLVTSGTTTSSYEMEITDVPSGDLTVQIYADGTLPVSFTMMKFERSEAPEPPAPTDPYWTVDDTYVTEYTEGEGSELTISAVSGDPGRVMAHHTETATGTNLTVTFTGGPVGASILVYNLTTTSMIGMISNINSQNTVTGTVAVGDVIDIGLGIDLDTSSSLPYTITAETSYS